MNSLDFDWQINEFMVYCRSTHLHKIHGDPITGKEPETSLFPAPCESLLIILCIDKFCQCICNPSGALYPAFHAMGRKSRIAKNMIIIFFHQL